MFSQFRWTLGTIWCSLNHESVLWPVHGHYECRTCGRRYPAFSEAPVGTWSKSATFRSAMSILLLGMGLAMSSRTAEAALAMKGQATLGAQSARERYTALAGAAGDLAMSVEIHASLSNSGKSAQLRAIRSLAPIGECRHGVLQLAGDHYGQRASNRAVPGSRGAGIRTAGCFSLGHSSALQIQPTGLSNWSRSEFIRSGVKFRESPPGAPFPIPTPVCSAINRFPVESTSCQQMHNVATPRLGRRYIGKPPNP
jgi:hypothetical protein